MALVASTTATGRWDDGKITPPLSHPHTQEDSALPSYEDLGTSDVNYEDNSSSDVWYEGFATFVVKDVESVHSFITAAAKDDEVMVKFFLNQPFFYADSMAPTVRMALQQAARNNNQRTVDIILQSDLFGVSEQDVEWLTPLYLAYARISTITSSELLDRVLDILQNGYIGPVPRFDIRQKYETFIQILLERHANGRHKSMKPL
ncbi:unnamed protein product [Clonostachys rhizophaga]|uniref:Uncharacterized protein n=1 Tax=Clonostachys rhizophaga TaxID=160324 RepID=A0A9N9VQ53_9HYPO|nr:unnamed protein product [Clonostachys rhizophaga]